MDVDTYLEISRARMPVTILNSFFREKFCVEFFDGGKWKKHFPVLFSGHMALLMNFMGLLIFPFK